MPDTATEPARRIARVIRTAWRSSPDAPALEALDNLEDLAPRLLDGGCGGLAWWAIRETSCSQLPGAASLHQSFRLHAIQAAHHARVLEQVLVRFNQAGLEPLLFKGWTLARLYAHPALRPYGDIDLLVAPGDESAARSVLAGLPDSHRAAVDLDMRVLDRFLPDRSFGTLADRSEVIQVGEARCRVLPAEDHLRLVCLHQLDHAGWRPLWLCDVAALLEGARTGFRWDVCLSGNARLSEAVLSLVMLAEELLGARPPPDTPKTSVPGWFRRSISRAWAGGYRAPPASLYTLHRLGWRGAFAALLERWPDPLTATLHLRAPMRGIPRLALQATECIRRALLFLHRTWREAILAPASPVAPGQGAL